MESTTDTRVTKRGCRGAVEHERQLRKTHASLAAHSWATRATRGGDSGVAGRTITRRETKSDRTWDSQEKAER